MNVKVVLKLTCAPDGSDFLDRLHSELEASLTETGLPMATAIDIDEVSTW